MNTPTDGNKIYRDLWRALRIALATDVSRATEYDKYHGLALACRNQLVDRWLETQRLYEERNVKRVYYLSLEFLMGRQLQNAVLNMDIEEDTREAMQKLGTVLEDIYEQEFEPGLGNGGLGRLAACFLDSLATLDIPADGYGIRYEYGIFRQKLANGYQVEEPDNWLFMGNPWETTRPENQIPITFYGHTEAYHDAEGCERRRWVGDEDVMAVPFEMPVPGFATRTVNTLRLWGAHSSHQFDLEYFNSGDYLRAVERKNESEKISKVLYPSDHIREGQLLRLKQQYFFVAASLHDIINRFKRLNDDLSLLPDKVAIQLNDTHPAIAIAEMMRILVDEEFLPWEESWELTRKIFAYTNHTILPEALEKWPVSLFSYLLPRHLEIIREIDRRHLEEIRFRFPCEHELPGRVAIIKGGGDSGVIHMANLAVVGSHSTNGVSALHTDILTRSFMADLCRIFPERFNNKTNGITPRRWLKQANPPLAVLIDRAIGPSWTYELDRLSELKKFVTDSGFVDEWMNIKTINKEILASVLRERQGIELDSSSLFDVQVKRIHEYKRQLLNLLRVIAYFFELKEGAITNPLPRTIMIGGKAAPSYHLAKLFIKLTTSIAWRINNDPGVKNLLKVVFLENYCVSVAERVIPATDLSEQISTAGFEASGTGNMKFALNGALTIGTLDGANVEIADAVGDENIYIFGLTADRVINLKEQGYDPWFYLNRNPVLRKAVESLRGEFFSPGQPDLFRPIYDYLTSGGDPYMCLADFASYHDCQYRVDADYRQQKLWTRKAILNVAAMGRFSSDRTISEYAREIWGVNPKRGEYQ